MQNRWSDKEAASFAERYVGAGHNLDVALRIYTSRLIGADSELVLCGGGNTSVKTRLKDDLGRDVDVLCVKASGRDLSLIEPEDMPALRLHSLLELRALSSLSPQALLNAQRSRMLDPAAPNPSVEALVHAFLPPKYVDHSHAGAILSLANQPEAEKIARELFEDRLGIVPYVMSGFGLAKKAAEVYESHPHVEGLLLLQHGLITFGADAREAYDRHIAAVEAAETHNRKRRYWVTTLSARPIQGVPYTEFAPVLRGALCVENRRYVLRFRDSASVRDFVDDSRVRDLTRRGMATADHVIRTKPFPLVLSLSGAGSRQQIASEIENSLAEYRDEYRTYVARNAAQLEMTVTPLDPDPRVILVPGVGLISAGLTVQEAQTAADVYEHTIEVIRDAEAVGSYRGLGEAETFKMEYWDLQQAKLDRDVAGSLQGTIVYITGAASGIGAATARLFVREGACAYLVDRDEKPLRELAFELSCACETVDVTDEMAVRASIDRAVFSFGGLDGIVSNAGYAPQSPIDTCTKAVLKDSFEVNLFAHQWVSSHATQVLRAQGRGGFLLYNASKAAFNPGAEFGPYAVPKAAVVALMKQYALEGGPLGIRSNAVNADRIRTGLFSEALIEERSRARGVAPDEYFKANLLHREVTGQDVAEAFLYLALAQSTTGCVITVDGGNIAASPR